jgi:hypothetical protein
MAILRSFYVLEEVEAWGGVVESHPMVSVFLDGLGLSCSTRRSDWCVDCVLETRIRKYDRVYRCKRGVGANVVVETEISCPVR